MIKRDQGSFKAHTSISTKKQDEMASQKSAVDRTGEFTLP